MNPFGFPWPTFLAFVVIGASIVAAVAWALADMRRERRERRGHGGSGGTGGRVR